MVHIASEVVVLVGLTFYFNQKNKKLMRHIEDLAQRVEEQEDLLQKHEQIIQTDYRTQTQIRSCSHWLWLRGQYCRLENGQDQ